MRILETRPSLERGEVGTGHARRDHASGGSDAPVSQVLCSVSIRHRRERTMFAAARNRAADERIQ